MHNLVICPGIYSRSQGSSYIRSHQVKSAAAMGWNEEMLVWEAAQWAREENTCPCSPGTTVYKSPQAPIRAGSLNRLQCLQLRGQHSGQCLRKQAVARGWGGLQEQLKASGTQWVPLPCFESWVRWCL